MPTCNLSMTSGLGSSDGARIETSLVNVISLNLPSHERVAIWDDGEPGDQELVSVGIWAVNGSGSTHLSRMAS